MLRSTRAEGFAHLMEALRAGLSQSGYDVGRNVAIEYRWADDQPDRLQFVALHMSLCGPNQTSRHVRFRAAVGG